MHSSILDYLKNHDNNNELSVESSLYLSKGLAAWHWCATQTSEF